MSTRMNIEEQANVKVLLAAGISPTAIAKKIGRDHKTVIAFSKIPATVQEVGELKQDLADAYEGLARRMVESITDEDITKINAYQRTIAAAAATDKMRLLRDQSTENIATILATHVIEAGKQWKKPDIFKPEDASENNTINLCWEVNQNEED